MDEENRETPSTKRLSLPVYFQVASVISMIIGFCGVLVEVVWITYLFVTIGMTLSVVAWFVARKQRNKVFAEYRASLQALKTWWYR